MVRPASVSTAGGSDDGGRRGSMQQQQQQQSNNQDFLSVAVHYPWARAISQNKVPYYIK